jgi:undecaprenyl-diphosphatase
VGVAQSVAILPGISRAGSTVCSGLLVGWERKEAVKFSFLLAIPVIIGATGFEVLKSTSALGSGGFVGLALLGLAVSALVGWVALHLFMKAVEGGKLWVFAVYSFLLGAAVTVYRLAA